LIQATVAPNNKNKIPNTVAYLNLNKYKAYTVVPMSIIPQLN